MADCALIPQQDTSTLECTIPTHLHSSLTLALDHDGHTLDYPTLAYDLGAPAPNHAHTTTTRSRCARDSVMCTPPCQDTGAHRPRSQADTPRVMTASRHRTGDRHAKHESSRGHHH